MALARSMRHATSALRDAAGLLANIMPVSRYIVDGPSMEPAYRSGDRLLVNRLAYRRHAPAVGDVIVIRDPERRGHYLIKRVATPPDEIPPETSHVYVLGDNAPESRDSRIFGPVPLTAVIGKAWLKY